MFGLKIIKRKTHSELIGSSKMWLNAYIDVSRKLAKYKRKRAPNGRFIKD